VANSAARKPTIELQSSGSAGRREGPPILIRATLRPLGVEAERCQGACYGAHLWWGSSRGVLAPELYWRMWVAADREVGCTRARNASPSRSMLRALLGVRREGRTTFPTMQMQSPWESRVLGRCWRQTQRTHRWRKTLRSRRAAYALRCGEMETSIRAVERRTKPTNDERGCAACEAESSLSGGCVRAVPLSVRGTLRRAVACRGAATTERGWR
jgi:hypothetical protein